MTNAISGNVIYSFLDGAFLLKTIESFHKKLDYPHPIEIDYTLISPNFEIIFDKKRAFLSSLRQLPNFHIRDGYTRNRPSAKSRIEQKGVDTWIAVDALLYALREIVDEIEVYTSDLDLYPLFETLVQTRSKGILRYEAGRTSAELIAAADVARKITPLDILGWTKNKDLFREYNPDYMYQRPSKQLERYVCDDGWIATISQDKKDKFFFSSAILPTIQGHRFKQQYRSTSRNLLRSAISIVNELNLETAMTQHYID